MTRDTLRDILTRADHMIHPAVLDFERLALAARDTALRRQRWRNALVTTGASAACILLVIFGWGSVEPARRSHPGPGQNTVTPAIVETPPKDGMQPGIPRDLRAGGLQGMTTSLRAQLAALEREADLRASLVRRTRALLESQPSPPTAAGSTLASARRYSADRPPLDPVLRAETHVGQAASILIAQGDRLREQHGLFEPAAERYRRVIRAFPDTYWAAVARDRLERMQHAKGDVS